MRLIILVLVTLTLLAASSGVRNDTRAAVIPKVFVDIDATGANNGTSWANAYTEVRSAFTAGAKEVWVAEGTYVVTTAAGQARKLQTLTLGDGLKVYGGFAGGETSRDQRDAETNPTILTGDLGVGPTPDGNPANNSYHVVTVPASAGATTLLDGFTIEGGNDDRANGTAGGIHIAGGSAVLANLVVRDNEGRQAGGAYVAGGNVAIRNSAFPSNASGNANTIADLTIVGGSPVIEDSHFGSDNHNLVDVSGGTPVFRRDSFTAAPTIRTGLSVNAAAGGSYTDLQFDGLSVRVSSPSALFDRMTIMNAESAAVQVAAGVLVSNLTITDVPVAIKAVSTGIPSIVRNVTISGVTLAIRAGTTPPGRPDRDGTPRPDNQGAVPFFLTIENAIVSAINLSEVEDGGTRITIRHSIIEGGCPDTIFFVCADVTDADPQLSALADNGGFTSTMAITQGTAAVDAGDNALCPDTDQRGITRPIDGDGDGTAGCDAGAFELEPLFLGFDLAASTAAESILGAALSVSLTKSAESTVTVDFAVTGGSASRPGDFTLTDGSLVFAPGTTSRSILVGIVDDGITDPNETVQITLSNPSGAPLSSKSAHTLTITEGAAPSLAFAASSATVTEKDRNVPLAVGLSPKVNGTVTVKYAVTGGSASNGPDYTLASGTLSFAPNDTGESIALALKDDLLVEPNETVLITLSAPTNAVLGAKKTFTLTIKDDEPRLKCDGKTATMVGGPGADILNGTPKPDVIVARGGNDTIDGKGGGDTICAGRGNDIAKGGNGNDIVLGDTGNDTLDGGGGSDDLRGGGGIDAIHGRGGNDQLRGEGNPDTLFGDGGKDRLSGGPGKPDRCDGGIGVDALLAGHGCEVVAGVP